MAYDNALAAVEHFPESRGRQEQAIDLRLDLRVPLQAMTRTNRLLEGDLTAESIARTLGDERRLGRIASGLANTLWITGDQAAAIAAASRALEIGQRLGDAATRTTAVLRLGAIHHTLGEYDTAAVNRDRQAAESLESAAIPGLDRERPLGRLRADRSGAIESPRRRRRVTASESRRRPRAGSISVSPAPQKGRSPPPVSPGSVSLAGVDRRALHSAHAGEVRAGSYGREGPFRRRRARRSAVILGNSTKNGQPDPPRTRAHPGYPPPVAGELAQRVVRSVALGRA